MSDYNIYVTLNKDWVDILSALLTPTIVLLGGYIAWQQSRTNRNRLKLELFDKRYKVYENIRKFIASILISARVEQGQCIEFLRDTKSLGFLFDDKIEKLTKEMYEKASRLHLLNKTAEGRTGDQIQNNLNQRKEIMEWFAQQLNDIDKVFKKYLKLTH